MRIGGFGWWNRVWGEEMEVDDRIGDGVVVVDPLEIGFYDATAND